MKTKKIVVLLLALLMVWAVLPPQGSAAAGRPSIMPDMDRIDVGDTVWFGNYSTSEYEPLEPVLWRVMGEGNNSGGNSKLLLSDRLLDSTPFYHAGFYNNKWQGSLAQTWCTGFYTNALSEVEKTVLISTSKSDAAYTGKYESFGTSSLIDEHVFFLSAEEAESIYFPYDDDSSRIAKELDDSDGTWWLRSPLNVGNDNAGIVKMDGKVSSQPTNYNDDVRPAFNLDLDPYAPLLFVSPGVGGKVSGPIGADALTAVPDTDTTEWKLTLRDDSRNFSVTWVAMTSKSFTFDYENAAIGPNEYISAILTGGDHQTISYYGRIAQPTASSGRLTVNFPVEASSATNTECLFIFSEQCNGDKQTDYASDLGSELSRYEPTAFAVTNTLTNMTTDNDAVYLENDYDWETGYVAKYDYSANLAADSGYMLPEDIIVKVGETTLTKGAGYDYNSTSGALLIPKENIDGDIEIVANGVRMQADITFDPSGGKWEDETTAPKVITANVGDEITIIAAPSRDGYEFQYWQGSVHHPGETYQVPLGGHRFIAVWEEITSTEPTETDPIETEPTETDPIETEPTETDPIETEPTETEPIETEPTETEPMQADITFDPSGGKWEDETTAPKVITANVGDEITIIGAPTRDGYEFLYWQGSEYHPGETYQVPIGGHTFTAVWKEITTTEPTETEPTEPVDDDLPTTGENFVGYLWLSLLLVVAGGLLLLLNRKKLSKQNN